MRPFFQNRYISPVITLFLGFQLAGCFFSTYYKKHASFNKAFEEDNLDKAEQLLIKDKKGPKGKERFLYFVNRGVTAHKLGDYEKSNEFLEKAHSFLESVPKDYVGGALSFIINPSITAYKGEDHEKLFVYYYKALNFLFLQEYRNALVECRRLNIKLKQLSDRYGQKTRYKKDAFIHTLMGVIYQANKEYNNAFIAYRNACNVYQEHYQKMFGIHAPGQLKQDLLFTAYQTGLYDQVRYYEKLFGVQYTPPKRGKEEGDVVCFWHNGLGPFKDQWSINFVVVKGAMGAVSFNNEELGLAFPFPMPGDAPQGLEDLKVLRVAFPKYVQRFPLYDKAWVAVDNQKKSFEILEDINAIALKTLKQRMLWEFSKTLLRLAVKKALEHQIGRANAGLGVLSGIVNAATEKADTRNWTTLPHSIYYTRLRLPAGKHDIQFHAHRKKEFYAEETQTETLNVHPFTTTFCVFDSVEVAPIELP